MVLGRNRSISNHSKIPRGVHNEGTWWFLFSITSWSQDNCTSWSLIKYCEGVFLILKGRIYYGNVIQELWAGMLVGRPPQGKCCRRDFGGPQFSKMQMGMPRTVMFSKELENHHTWMNFLCNWYGHCKPLRNWKSTFWDLLTHKQITLTP